MAVSPQVAARRAIEALRSGVPNRDAVKALGSAQSHIEEKFRQQLEAVRDNFTQGKQTPGLVVAGDFGSGKSHLLEYLQHLALDANFVCSKVVISKETPLHDLAKLYRAAIQSAVVPEKRGAALTEIAGSLNFNSKSYAHLFTWVNNTATAISSQFAATLFLYERVKDEEVRDRIVSFWSGDPLKVGELRSWLRHHGEAATYKLESVAAKDLPLHRFKFASRLVVAAGYSGWVLLVDEVELIGRYTFKQRARSYAELARWVGKLEGQVFPGLTTVFAITADFETRVLYERRDEELIPGRLRASGVEADALLASQAQRGMRLISDGSEGRVWLKAPEPEVIKSTQDRVRDIHARAYHWDPPALATAQQPRSERRRGRQESPWDSPAPPTDRDTDPKRMRQHVRRWINEWDLLRLYPGYTPDTIIEDLKQDYTENPDLETPSEGTGDVDS